MPFQLRPYSPPVFSTPALENAPDAVFRPAPRDGVAPENFHAMSIFPEYFKIAGQWHLARESRMDCVAVWDRGRIDVREFRRLRQGELVAVGRTEQGEEGILVHPLLPLRYAAAVQGDVCSQKRLYRNSFNSL